MDYKGPKVKGARCTSSNRGTPHTERKVQSQKFSREEQSGISSTLKSYSVPKRLSNCSPPSVVQLKYNCTLGKSLLPVAMGLSVIQQ